MANGNAGDTSERWQLAGISGSAGSLPAIIPAQILSSSLRSFSQRLKLSFTVERGAGTAKLPQLRLLD